MVNNIVLKMDAVRVHFTEYEYKSNPIGYKCFTPTANAQLTEYNISNVTIPLVVDYLNVGRFVFNSRYKESHESALAFVSKYGTMAHTDDRTYMEEITGLMTPAKNLFHIFYEINRFITGDRHYVDYPILKFETGGVEMKLSIANDRLQPICVSSDLRKTIEFAFTQIVTQDEMRLRICKHCNACYFSGNTMSEFCSPRCRNQFNVYAHRARKKKP